MTDASRSFGAERVTSLVVSAEETSTRLDVVLARRIPGLSRSRIQRMIRDRWVTVDGQHVRNNFQPSEGAFIRVVMPPADRTDVIAEDIPLDIVFEDEELLVVNKPAAMVVHPARGNYTGTLVNALLHHCDSLPDVKGETRPGIVHRLDKGTSGLLMVAKTELAQTSLTLQLKLRKVRKIYQAIVWGRVDPAEGAIEQPIGRHPRNPKLMSVRREPGKGRPSLSVYRTLEDFGKFTHVEVDIRTGRTHQIRVHFRFIGRMVLGDPSYGGRSGYLADLPPEGRRLMEKVLEGLGRQALHAHRLEFNHPATGERLTFQLDPPEDFAQVVEALRRGRDQEFWAW